MKRDEDREDELLRSVALQNANAILLARQRAEKELVQAREALRESAERLQIALSAAALGTWSWEAATDLVSLSERAAEIFGLPRHTPVTWARMRELLHEDDREPARIALERAAATRSDYHTEHRLIRPSGLRWVVSRGRPTYARNGTLSGMTGVVQDITERRELLESERAARAQAERASAMKDEFLATLSHELRTPLSAILGWAQLLRRGVRNESDLMQGLETIERNARIQTQLIEDLLDMSRITSGKLRLDIQSVEPVPFIEEALETVRPAAEAKGVKLEKILDPAAGPIAGDASRLQQVVWNLLSNAIKFTPRGGKVQVLLERVNSHIEISVADTGIGIPAEFLPHVFERFRQADASTTRNFGGLGLGLSIVKTLVEMHGGSVAVKSPGEGRGATFSVLLPVSAVHRDRDVADRLHPSAPRPLAADFDFPDLDGVTVLVVDDEPDARGLIERVLTECRAEVVTSRSARDALEILRGRTVDVLVSDIGMPGTDGYEFLKEVRGLPGGKGRKLPAVALTAFARSEDRTRALRAGFLLHVSKPVEPSELVATVAALAGRIETPAGD